MGIPSVAKRQAFIKAWEDTGGSPKAVAQRLGCTERAVYNMRLRMAGDGLVLRTEALAHGGNKHGWKSQIPKWPKRRDIKVRDRVVIIGSDAHIWPGIHTTAMQAFLKLCRSLDPEYVILNGDTLDGSTISRHDPIVWEARPALSEELEAVSDWLHSVKKAAPNAKTLSTLGNHSTRFERYLAIRAPAMRDVKGSRLEEHFVGWPLSWSIMINESVCPVMVKHAFKGGAHAVYNSTLHAGVSIVCGHLHAQLVRPFTDYRGTRYGVDAGTLADITGDQFFYTLDSPVNWRAGFCVLTFDKKGNLLPPELCEVQTNGKERTAYFRGKIIAEGIIDE